MSKRVTLLRSDNRLVVEPTTQKIRSILIPELVYIEKKWLRGKEKYTRRNMGLPEFDEILWECYGVDHKDRLSTSFGFYDRIVEALTRNDYKVVMQWSTKKEAAIAEDREQNIYKPHWDRIDKLMENGFEFRYKQKLALKLIAEYEDGRIDCHGGWGKGTLIMLACSLFPNAKIDVVTKRVAVMHQRIYPELVMNLPSVGLIGGGKRIKNRRIMCITADSLHHGRPDADFVFVDEGHEACADKFAESLGQYEHARMWSFSATWDMRLDNKNLRAEAIFGPIRIKVPYSEGVKHNIVVPIEVFWNDVIMDTNPCADLEGTEKDRIGIWSNDFRNKIIRKIAHRYDDDIQVLITVATLEHALNLKKLLPEFEIVYSPASQKDDDWRDFGERNLLFDKFKPISDIRRAKLTERFEKGHLKKVIATTVWNVGVNFRHLQVLIRAEAGGSPTTDTQIPCRNARKHMLGDHLKPIGIIHDLKDQFDRGYRQKALKRFHSYESNEWQQHEPNKRKSKLRKRMNWGSK